MSHYKNFKSVVYIPAGITARGTKESIAREYDYIEKYIGLDKVYLEAYRGGDWVDRDQVLLWKNFLESKGVEVAGGMTTVTPDVPEEQMMVPKQRIFGTFCYTNKAMREKVRKAAEYTASIFDEFILDDFYFTNCTCEECIRAKGDRSWTDFRRDLMTEVSRDLIVGPAKKVNPKCHVIIKYPNWRESFHFTGYVPETEIGIFDGVYTGTETRSPRYQDQHFPSYLSYALVRWFENAAPGRNGGGWFDPYQCWSTDRYLEQAFLTAFSRARELMHFEWKDLIDNRFTAPLGEEYRKIDAMLSKAGNPVGVPVYIPFASAGDNHVEMRLGMQGVPVEMTPYFPENAPLVFLTSSALADPGIYEKVRKNLLSGGDVVVTTGFAEGLPQEQWHELSELVVTDNTIAVDRYNSTDVDSFQAHTDRQLLFHEIRHGNNASWSVLNGGSGEYHTPLFIVSNYGAGRLWTLNVPENQGDFARIPEEMLDPVRKVLNVDGVYTTGRNVSMFQYDDGSFILYRYVREPIHTVRVTVHSGKPAAALEDVTTGKQYEVHHRKIAFNLERGEEWTADVDLQPGVYRMFRFV